MRLAECSTEEMALGFINALKLQGLEDAAESQTMYTFDGDTEYPDGKISISMVAVRGAPRAKTIRSVSFLLNYPPIWNYSASRAVFRGHSALQPCLRTHLSAQKWNADSRDHYRSSVMYALSVLPITLMNDNHLAGVEFFENYRQRRLYDGVLNDIGNLLRPGLGNSNTSAAATSKKRSSHPYQLTVQELNATTILITVLGEDHPKLEAAFHLIGLPLPKVGFFSTIITMIYRLGLHDATGGVHVAEMSDDNMSAWIFVRESPRTTFDFAVYHLLALLEGIARYSVQRGIYRELVYDLFTDGELVCGGCVTQPVESRRWCAGLRGEGLHGIEEGDFPAYRAP